MLNGPVERRGPLFVKKERKSSSKIARILSGSTCVWFRGSFFFEKKLPPEICKGCFFGCEKEKNLPRSRHFRDGLTRPTTPQLEPRGAMDIYKVSSSVHVAQVKWLKLQLSLRNCCDIFPIFFNHLRNSIEPDLRSARNWRLKSRICSWFADQRPKHELHLKTFRIFISIFSLLAWEDEVAGNQQCKCQHAKDQQERPAGRHHVVLHDTVATHSWQFTI